MTEGTDVDAQALLARDVFDRLGMIPTPSVGDRVEVGEIITRTASRVKHETSLTAELAGLKARLNELNPQLSESDRALLDESFPIVDLPPERSQRPLLLSHGVQSAVDVGGGAVVARVQVRFESAQGYVFLLRGGHVRRFETMLSIRRAMLLLRRVGVWQPEWQLISGVRIAESFTVLLAGHKGAAAEADLSAGAAGVAELEALGATLKASRSDVAAFEYPSGEGTPLYQSLVVQGRWRPRTADGLEIRDGGAAADEPLYTVEPVEPGTILVSGPGVVDVAETTEMQNR